MNDTLSYSTVLNIRPWDILTRFEQNIYKAGEEKIRGRKIEPKWMQFCVHTNVSSENYKIPNK